MKTVYTKIAGDLFHYGHVRFLRAARSLGQRLVVHVVDDRRVSLLKQHRPIMTQQERMEIVQSCRYVDQVDAEGPKIITREFMLSRGYQVYAFACADESEMKTKLADCPDLPPEMLGVLSYTPGISTSDLIRRILQSKGPC